jgi:outer membrane receptor protein involved in Fe transport
MDFAGLSKARARLIGGAVIFALGSGLAMAQTAVGTVETTDELETAVVSSTRLQNAGFDAPTPTQVLNSEDLAKIAQPNLFDAVIELPALQGSTGQTYETGSTSTGLQGLSAFSLRGFSPLRTLTLLDGERVVGANYNGIVDVSQLPQILVQRVDVVTGGASASWGSDAVAGVVNIVTDKKFEGFKVDASYGTSTYNDNHTPTIKMAAGTSFLGGRAHVEVAADYENDQGVITSGSPWNNFGCAALDGRNFDTCSSSPSYGSAKNTPAGQPELNWTPFGQTANTTTGGLIISGPLHGTAFGANGAPYAFNFAGGGVPSLAGFASGGAGISGCPTSATCISTPSQPGDLSNQGQPTTLVQPIQRDTFFTRVSFDITPSAEIFATFNYANSNSNSEPTPAFGRPNLTIACNNAYLPASVAAACTADYPSGTMAYGIAAPFSNYQNVNIDRLQRRFVIGGDGSFDLFSKKWTWDTYAEYAEAPQYLRITNMPLLPNFYAAINAIAGTGTGAGGNGIPVGQIGCAEAAARAAGCQPYDIIGTGVTNTAAASNYIMPPHGPFADTTQRQEAFGATLNTKPFADWAGDIALAVGVDYRLENFHLRSDPYGNGITVPVADPYTSTYPANPAICNCNYGSFAADTTAGGAWYAGNYHEGGGQYTVDEVFVETGVPLYKTPGWGSLDADLGARFEHYSQSGNWTTWKIGLVWDTPAPGVRIRAIESEDLRAPNLSEIYTPPVSINNSANDPFLPGNPSLEANQITAGNLLLTPETSKTDELGIVFQPEYIRGFRASADYYHISVQHIIQSIGAPQTVVNNCAAGNATFCGQSFIPTLNAVPYTAGGIPTAYYTPLSNVANVVTTGVDLETSYQFKLDNWGIPGNFAIRALGTKTYKWVLCPGVVGAVCANNAGALGNYTTSGTYNSQGGTIPTWKVLYSEDYTNSIGSFTLIQRWFNAGTFSNNDIQCNPGSCPVQTAFQAQNYPTINYNHMPGAIYWDAGAAVNVLGTGQIYVKVNNIANLLPPPSAGGFNGTIYDVIGRMYYVGVRYHL